MTGPTLRYGSTGPDVVRWQNVIGVPADGKFGPITLDKTKTWQRAHGLTADGVVGPLTWASASAVPSPIINELVSPPSITQMASPVPIAQPTVTQMAAGTVAPPTLRTSAPATSTTRPTLRSGSRGTYVAEWQRIIGVTPDSIFGPNTVNATKAFQSKNGLVADGVVGPKTWDVGLMLRQMSNRTPASTTTPKVTTTVSTPRTPILRRVASPIKTAIKPKLDDSDIRWDRIAMVGGGVAGVGLFGFGLYKLLK